VTAVLRMRGVVTPGASRLHRQETAARRVPGCLRAARQCSAAGPRRPVRVNAKKRVLRTRACCVTGGLPRTGRHPDRRNVPDTARFGSVIRCRRLAALASGYRRPRRPTDLVAGAIVRARTPPPLRRRDFRPGSDRASGPDEQPVGHVPVPGPAGDRPGVRHAVVDDGGGQAADLDGAPDGRSPARTRPPVAPGGIGRRGARPSGSPARRGRGERARRSRRATAPRPPGASPPAVAPPRAAPAARRSTPRRAPIRRRLGSPRGPPARHPCRRAPAVPAARRPCGPVRRPPARGADPRGAAAADRRSEGT
jgi:hypothetical protein